LLASRSSAFQRHSALVLDSVAAGFHRATILPARVLCQTAASPRCAHPTFAAVNIPNPAKPTNSDRFRIGCDDSGQVDAGAVFEPQFLFGMTISSARCEESSPRCDERPYQFGRALRIGCIKARLER